MKMIRKWWYLQCMQMALDSGPEYGVTARYFRIKANTI